MRVSWPEVMREIHQCTRCPLWQGRLFVVPGEGNLRARLMLIGEGPGAQENETGRPFVGAAGQLLDKMLAAIGLSREEVYIANIVKCRPPQNRVPTPDEAQACLAHLRAQVALIKPQVIVCLGATSARYVVGDECRITRDRGRWVEKKGVWIMPTFHPAALLRDESKKRPAWEDFKAVRDKLAELEEKHE